MGVDWFELAIDAAATTTAAISVFSNESSETFIRSLLINFEPIVVSLFDLGLFSNPIWHSYGMLCDLSSWADGSLCLVLLIKSKRGLGDDIADDIWILGGVKNKAEENPFLWFVNFRNWESEFPKLSFVSVSSSTSSSRDSVAEVDLIKSDPPLSYLLPLMADSIQASCS